MIQARSRKSAASFELKASRQPSRRHDTGTLYDWLAAAFSYQGISDRVATGYMAQHGRARWADIDVKIVAGPACPKLKSYWHFHDCQYEKGSRTCTEPNHIDRCPARHR